MSFVSIVLVHGSHLFLPVVILAMLSPTIVIVHGACQPPSLYAPFAEALEAHSIHSIVIPTPSVDPSPGLKDFSEDVVLIRKTVVELIDEAKDVIVVMHSYGGIPGSSALQGLGKSTREGEGKTNGVVRLVYVCSFALKEGEQQPGAGDMEQLRKYAGTGLQLDEEVRSSQQRSCSIFKTWMLIVVVARQAGTLLVTPPAAAYTWFHDLPEKDAQHWSSLLKPSCIGALWSKQIYSAWKDIPSTYVVCELDRVLPVERQEGMIKSAKEVQPKAFDVVERLQSGHEPMLSKIDEMVKILEKATCEEGNW